MKNSQLTTNTKSSSKYTEDWIPIKAISNGTILLDNKLKVTGVKIRPRNIFILDQQSQDSALIALKNFYNTIDFEFWLIVSDRVVDISLYQSQLQLLYNNVSKPKLRKLIMQDINKANLFMSRDYNVVDTEYTFLFKEKKMELVQKKLHTLISGLSNAGLNSTQTSNADLRMLLDNYLNDGISTNFRAVM